MNGTGTQSAREFLGAVDAACSDLAPADRARLLGGLEEHLAELSADGVDLVAELGDPVAYAAELRSAAGLPAARAGAHPLPAAGVVAGPPAAVTRSGPSTGKVLLVVGAVLAGVAVLVTAALLLGGLLLFGATGGGGVVREPVATAPAAEVTVPDVTGMNQEQAREVLTQAGLTVGSASSAGSSDVPVDLVVSQDPVAGTAVAPGSTVSLVVSAGP